MENNVNARIFKRTVYSKKLKKSYTFYAIHEVEYDKEENVISIGKDPIELSEESVNRMFELCKMCVKAFKLPVLNEEKVLKDIEDRKKNKVKESKKKK